MTAFYWHGAMMAVAWLVLIPAGALIARFFKVRPHQDFPAELDDHWWWNAHRTVQSLAAGMVALALWWAYDALGTIAWQVPHVQFGIVAVALLAAQIVSPFLRGSKGGRTDPFADPADPLTWRGDHYDMSPRRRIFELWHKKAGYGAMAAAVMALWTGIDAAGLEAWWKLIVFSAVAVFVTLFARWTRQRRRVDTWLAIFGPDGH